MKSELDSAVLISLLAWPDRTREQKVSLSSIGPLSSTFQAHFGALFPHLRRLVADTELAECWRRLSRDSGSYRDWWKALLASNQLDIDFVDREPIIALDSLERWEKTLDHLDADALVTKALAGRQGSTNIEADIRALSNWSTVIKASDRELERLWRRGVSDMHIHVSGVRFAHITWFDLMDEIAAPAAFAGLARDGSFPEIVEQARLSREALWGIVGLRPAEDAPLRDDENRWWRWDRRRLLGERLLLTMCWIAEDRDDLILHLDRYLTAKSYFMHLARQPYETAPGLDVFTSFARALKTRDLRVPPSPRLIMQPFGDALAFLAEAGDLQRAELRFEPASSQAQMSLVAAYFDTLAGHFRAHQRKQTAERPPLDARLAFHLKRSRGKKDRADKLATLLIGLDRQTAALRLALSDPGLGVPLRRWLARLDIAGQERDTSIIECAPYIRLATGDDAALADLGKQKDDDPRHAEYAHWKGLLARGEHRAALTERRLGVTIHAGEDFADPLSGLHEVASAVAFGGLGPGDGIGHGLALVVDGESFMRERGGHAMISRGVHIDSMAWLVDLLDSDGYEGPGRLRHQLRQCIESHAGEVFKRRVLVPDVIWLRQARARCCTPDLDRLDEQRRELWRMHATDEVRAARDQLIPLPESRRASLDALQWAQQHVLQIVKTRRIIVELNPSSNLRISASQTADRSPTIDLLLEVDQGLLASVNTDNPGTFLSRIENEYGLLVIGCRKRNIAEWRIRDLLDRVRSVGLDATYWPTSDRKRIE